MLPDERKEKYLSLGVSELNANKLIQNRSLSDYFNQLLDKKLDHNTAANLLLGDISAYLNKEEKDITDTTLTIDRFIDLIECISSKTITSKNLKEILEKVLTEETSIKEIISSSDIKNITDTSELTKIVEKIISENEESVNDYKNGHDRAIKYLMGQVMKETHGGANPELAMSILKDKLDN